MVEQRLATGSATVGRFLSLGGANNLGYATDILITMPGSGSYTVPVYSNKATPRIITFLSNSATFTNVVSPSKGVFINGGNGNITGATVTTTQTGESLITATSTGYIGRDNSTSFYNGEIAEVIIYNRALKVDERNDIQNYLSKKYGIKVTISA